MLSARLPYLTPTMANPYKRRSNIMPDDDGLMSSRSWRAQREQKKGGGRVKSTSTTSTSMDGRDDIETANNHNDTLHPQQHKQRGSKRGFSTRNTAALISIFLAAAIFARYNIHLMHLNNSLISKSLTPDYVTTI